MGSLDKDGVFIPDYIQIPTIVLMDEELEPNDFLTYGAVYWYYRLNDNTNDQICKASNERLGKIVGISEGAVANSLTRLEKQGHIQRVFKDDARKHRLEIIPLVVYAKVARFTEGLNQIHGMVNLDSRNGEQKERRKENKNGEEPEQHLSPLNAAGSFPGKSGKEMVADRRSTPEELKEAWNKAAESSKLPKVVELSGFRRDKCRARLAERPLNEWENIFSLMAKSPFLNGKNDRQWRASFDWITANDNNGVKVLEGKYDSGEPAGPATRQAA
jgi:hypothetical protein